MIRIVTLYYNIPKNIVIPTCHSVETNSDSPNACVKSCYPATLHALLKDSKPLLFKGLNIRIPIVLPIKGEEVH